MPQTCPMCAMMMNGSMGWLMMIGIGVVGLLLLVFLILGIAALAKYLFFSRPANPK
jgi:hypothetical protein